MFPPSFCARSQVVRIPALPPSSYSTLSPTTLSRTLLTSLKPYQSEYNKLGQGHVFDNLDQVSDANLAHLLASAENFSLPFLLQAYRSFTDGTGFPNEEVLTPYSSHGLDLSRLTDEQIYNTAINSIHRTSGSSRLKLLSTHQVPKDEKIAEPSQDDLNFYLYTALEALIRGESGSVLLAGGQGSRLKFDKPKALFPIESPSNQTLLMRTLYNHQLLLELAKQYYDTTYPNGGEGLPVSSKDITIPLIILTSPQTDSEMHAYFNNLNEQIKTKNQIPYQAPPPLWLTDDMISSVYFVQQSNLPAITRDGKLVLSDDKLMLSPNGNGGVFGALFPLLEGLSAGTISPHYPNPLQPPEHSHRKYNLKHVMFLNIDNICNKVCDPIMLGYTIAHKAQISVKTIPKSNPAERVGVVGVKDGRVQMVEYTEIQEAAHERDDRGVLKYIDGNTNIIIYSTEFLFQFRPQLCAALASTTSEGTQNGMPLHRADKQGKIRCNHQRYGDQEPDESTLDIIKFELFAFDAFVYADRITIVRTNRNMHFLPVKSQDHEDFGTIAADTPRYCLDRSNKVATMTLIRLGYHIYDVNGKLIVNSFSKNGDDGEPLDQLGFRHNKTSDSKDTDDAVALSLAEYGQGIELDVTRFYAFTYPAFDLHPNKEFIPHCTIFDGHVDQSTQFIEHPIINEHKIIRLSIDYGMILHSDGSITKTTREKNLGGN